MCDIHGSVNQVIDSCLIDLIGKDDDAFDRFISDDAYLEDVVINLSQAVEHEINVEKRVSEFLVLHKSAENKVAKSIHKVFKRQEKLVLHGMEIIANPRMLDENILLPSGQNDKELEDAIVPEIMKIVRAGVKDSLKSVGISKELNFNPLVNISASSIAVAQNTMKKFFGKTFFQNINKTTRDGLRQTIINGIKNNLSTPGIAKLISSKWLFSWKRALRIARTETTAALNVGHYTVSNNLASAPGSNIRGREWVSILDQDTRKEHRVADGQRVMQQKGTQAFVVIENGKIIGNGQQFILANGERARFPGDPTLSAGQRINCRCTMINVFDQAPASIAQAGAQSVAATISP